MINGSNCYTESNHYSIYICLYIHLFIYLSIYLSIYLVFFIFFYLYIYIYSIFLYIYLSIHLSICIFIHLSIYLAIYQYFFLSKYISRSVIFLDPDLVKKNYRSGPGFSWEVWSEPGSSLKKSWIRIRFVLRGLIQIRSISDRSQNPAERKKFRKLRNKIMIANWTNHWQKIGRTNDGQLYEPMTDNWTN